jgi:hypothetical protein
MLYYSEFSETRRSFMTIVFQFYFSIYHEGVRKSGGIENGWNMSISGLQSNVTLLRKNVYLKENYRNNGRH